MTVALQLVIPFIIRLLVVDVIDQLIGRRSKNVNKKQQINTFMKLEAANV